MEEIKQRINKLLISGEELERTVDNATNGDYDDQISAQFDLGFNEGIKKALEQF